MIVSQFIERLQHHNRVFLDGEGLKYDCGGGYGVHLYVQYVRLK